MVRNRAFRVLAAALAASLAALTACAALGFLLLMGLMVTYMPHSVWAGILVGGLLVVVFGWVFLVCFREMLEKLTQQ